MQAKPERGSLPESEPGRRRAPHYSRTRVASRTPAAFYRFETRPAVPSDPAKRPSIRPLPTLAAILILTERRLAVGFGHPQTPASSGERVR
jgi:hypothetical protein